MTYVNHRDTGARRIHRERFGGCGMQPGSRWVHPHPAKGYSVRSLCLCVLVVNVRHQVSTYVIGRVSGQFSEFGVASVNGAMTASNASPDAVIIW